MDIWSALWLLMAWCFSSAEYTHLCISSCNGLATCLQLTVQFQKHSLKRKLLSQFGMAEAFFFLMIFFVYIILISGNLAFFTLFLPVKQLFTIPSTLHCYIPLILTTIFYGQYNLASLWCGPIWHDITYSTALTEAEHKSETHTLHCSSSLWDVYGMDLGENRTC